jgi:colanic acid biosynthesis glycosyl transferase WcaI
LVFEQSRELTMRILFLGLNYAPEAIGIGPYSSGMCEALVAAGHAVHAVVGQPYYPDWRVTKEYRGSWRKSVENGVEVLRCPLYVPASPSGLKRILHHMSFAVSALVPTLRRARAFRPDIVLTVAPSLVAAPLAKLAASISGARSWLHIQDFEVEAAFATGLIGEAGMPAKAARRFEHAVVRSFDRVSSISPEMCAKLRGFGVPESAIVEFRNWSDVDQIRPLDGASPYRAEWGVRTPHVALYSGNIANKQGIEIVLEAARLLAHRKDLTFIVCGQGPNRARLEVDAGGDANIMFRDLQPAERLGDLLGLATIHLLPQKAGAADLVLPSKLTNMLASGRPVVASAAQGTGLAREVHGCGIATEPDNPVEFAAAIERLIDSPQLHGELSRAAREAAMTVWARESVLGRFIGQLDQVA